MKKLLTFVVMAMMAVSASAQLVAEKDWTGVADLPVFVQFADEMGIQGSAEMVADGIAITVNQKTGQLWQPQLYILEGFNLAKNGNYIVNVVAKFPCDGQLQINMGSWSYNEQYDIPVKATGDFQEVEVEFPEYCADATDAHVLFECGDFLGTTIVKSVKVYSETPSIHYNQADISYKFIAKGKVAEVISNPYKKYRGIVEIPASVMHDGEKYPVSKIADNAFANCRSMSSVTIPNSVTSIGSSAFSGCTGLTSVTIPNSVTSIGYSAFSGCSSLTSVTIPNSVKTIDGSAFSSCTGLTSIAIPNGLTSIGGGVFSGCTGLTSIAIPNNVTSIGDYAFDGCTGLTTVTIPNSVTYIGWDAFRGCTGLTSITIPNSVISIGGWALSGCSSLSSITIPNGVTFIDQSSFYGCTGLSSITIPNNVTSIDNNAFQNCNNMSSVTIGEKVSNISSGAFANCQQLTDVFCLAGNVPNTASDAFNGSYIEYATLHVPAASLSSYSNSEPWKNIKNIVAIGSGEIPEVQKCATPTIKFENGVVKFSCATSGAEFVSTITPVGNNTKYDSEIVINNTYKVTVYATKAGYNNSDTATIEIQANSGVKGDVNADGKVNAADHVELSKIILNQ